MTEAPILAAIMKALEQLGVECWRAGVLRLRVKGGYARTGKPGLPDIICVIPPDGRLLGLEVKSATGKEREAQMLWAGRVRNLGATVVTVRSPQEAVDAWRAATMGAR